ncbi:hypothetical protein Pfo_029727 [Paulownia fortunei]|nr:hypothetical protein Pfo_029727 [Paulownia fortunei]
MSFPDPPPPSHPFMSLPFAGSDSARFWPPYLLENEQPDIFLQFDRLPPFKRPRNSENPQKNFAPFPAMNPRMNPGSKGTSHIFHKTRICANGEHCTFAHGVEDLREPPSNWQELIREKGDDQRMIHRMKTCKKYYNGEECTYGENCNFLHDLPHYAPPTKFKVDVPRKRESSVISIGTTGDAAGSSSSYFDQIGNLDTCQSKTVFWKTKLCSKWEMGQCPFAEKCHFAYGQSEMTSKWKLTNKINRIYADWLDDQTPPYCPPSKGEV